jgi:hypothetical protein
MKKSVIAVIALAAMLFAGSANANLIGIFADQEASNCTAAFPVYAYTNVYVCAVLSTIDAITAAEFLIDGINTANPLVIISPTWNSPLTIGNAFGADGFSIAFQTAQPGPIVVLGSVQFFPINAAWLAGQPPIWCVVQTNDSMKLVLVDADFQDYDAMGWCFVPECVPGGDYGDCSCMAIPTEDTSWGAVKSLY